MPEFTYEIKNDKKDGHEYAEITGCVGETRDLCVPSEIDGCRVEALGNHSFSGRQDIYTVSIPESVRILYGFAFHNCRNLRKISLFDTIDDYYDGVCRQCDSLSEVEITLKRGWYEVVRNFLADNDKTLRFMLHTESEGSACLTFPEYVYDFADNTMARTIQFSIAGSGYAYRECVDRRSINYREYDRLFDRAVIDGNAIPEDIALGRLFYPLELEDTYKEKYEQYVKKNSGSILKRFITEGADGEDKLEESTLVIKKLLKYRNVSGDRIVEESALDAATRLATEKRLTTLCAEMVEAGRNAGAETNPGDGVGGSFPQFKF
ncbi:MAG: leucine-rich repeat domain-containing protein [Butyrivibrio sp.]|nr:leucine-rich repeat domain-containing protein [Butyrivibrio sp.]